MSSTFERGANFERAAQVGLEHGVGNRSAIEQTTEPVRIGAPRVYPVLTEGRRFDTELLENRDGGGMANPARIAEMAEALVRFAAGFRQSGAIVGDFTREIVRAGIGRSVTMRVQLDVQAPAVGIADLGGAHDMELAALPPIGDRHAELVGAFPKRLLASRNRGQQVDPGDYARQLIGRRAGSLQDVIDGNVDDRQLVAIVKLTNPTP